MDTREEIDQSEIMALGHIELAKETENPDQGRLLTDIQSVVTFYGLPKKQVKLSGKICNVPFEEFDMNLYKPRENFNGFRTSPPRLPVWILAFFKILYDRLGKTDEYLLDWKDVVDNDMQFDRVKCSLRKAESAELIIRIYLKTSSVTVQGVDHVWFVTEIFPEIRDAFNALCAPELSPLSTESLQSSSDTSPVKRTIKKPIPSQIPVSIKSQVKQTTSSPLVNHTDLLQLSNIESRITDMLQSIDKLNLENVLKTTVENYNELIKRIGNLEAKVSKLPAQNVANELPTLKMLVDKLTILESNITNTPSNVSRELLDSKEKQISLLMDEITEKNKEIQKLKKANSSISSNKDEMNHLRQAVASCKMSLKHQENYENELNDAITLLKEKQLEIKSLNEDLTIMRNKLHEKEEEIVLLQSENVEMKNQILQMESIEKDLVIAKKELVLTKAECLRQSNVLSEKNGSIHDLLLSKYSQDRDGSSFKVDQGNINMSALKEADHTTSQNLPNSLVQDVVLTGDSLIKQVVPERLIHSSHNIRVIKHEAFHLDNIHDLVDLPNVSKVSAAVIHCGTNDIKLSTADVCFQKTKKVISHLQDVNPDIKIVVSNIAPRGDDEFVDINRQEHNIKLLKEYNLSQNVMISENNNLSKHGTVIKRFYGHDQIHLNQNGSRVLAANISISLKSMMGIPFTNPGFH